MYGVHTQSKSQDRENGYYYKTYFYSFCVHLFLIYFDFIYYICLWILYLCAFIAHFFYILLKFNKIKKNYLISYNLLSLIYYFFFYIFLINFSKFYFLAKKKFHLMLASIVKIFFIICSIFPAYPIVASA